MKGLWQKTRVIAWAWVLAAALLLSACAGPGGRAAPEDDHAPEEGWGYFLERGELPGDMALSTGQFVRDESLYLCGMDRDNAPLLYRCRGEALTAYPLPEDARFLHACCADGDGLAVLAGDFPALWWDAYGELRENTRPSGRFTLLTYDAQGQLGSSLSLEAEGLEGLRFRSLCCDGSFYSLTGSNGELFLLDRSGAPTGRFRPEDGSVHAQLLTEQGLLLALTQDGADHVVRLTDPAALRFETLYTDPEGSLNALGESGENALLLRSDDAIECLSLDTGERQLCFDFRANGLMSVACTQILSLDGRLLLAGANQRGLETLSYGPLPEKQELLLWLGPFESPVVRRLADAFNRDSPLYRVRIETADPEDAAIRAEIIAGRGADLYCVSPGSPLGAFGEEGVMEDLLPWLESAEGPGRDCLPPAVLDAVAENDRLYTMPITVGFGVMMCVRPDLVTPEMSLDEVLSLEPVRDGSVNLVTREAPRATIWMWLRNLYLSDHLDTEHGVCDFDTEKYAAMLRLCLDAEPDENTIHRDEIPYLFWHEGLDSVARLYGIQDFRGDRYFLATALGCFLEVPDSISLSVSSEHREGALAFIRYALGSDLDMDPELLPASRETLERYIQKSVTTGFQPFGMERPERLNEYTLAQFRALLEQPLVVADRYPELIRIMDEEAERFFAGDRTAEEAAAATQSRAAIYMAERFG